MTLAKLIRKDDPLWTPGGSGTSLEATVRDDDANWPLTGGGGVFKAADIFFARDEKASGTAGGDFTLGAWRTRAINTVLTNEIGASLADNQITLPAGTYWIEAEVPGFICGLHKAKLFNVSDNADVMLGSSDMSLAVTNRYANTPSYVIGQFTIAAEKTFELQHQCGTTRLADGFGPAASFGTEVFVTVRIWKAADLPAVFHVRDEKASGTNGGGYTATAWIARDLNTVVTALAGASLAANQITLPAGTYWIEAESPQRIPITPKIQLYNVSDTATAIVGTPARGCETTGQSTLRNRIRGQIVIAGEKTFEVRFHANQSVATTGLGIACSFGTEIYTDLRAWKVA